MSPWAVPTPKLVASLVLIPSDHSTVEFVLEVVFLFGVLTVDGDDGIRTHDPLLAGQVLSQLSYTPTLFLPHSIYHSMSFTKAHSKLNNKSDSVLSNPISSG